MSSSGSSEFVRFSPILHSSVREHLLRRPMNMSPLQHIGYTFEVTVALALHKAGAQQILTNPLQEVEQWTRQQRLGVDIVLPRDDIIIEVKNNDSYYWLERIMMWTGALSRFYRTDPEHRKRWVIVLANSTLTPDARELLEKHHVTIISVEQFATRRTMPNIVKLLARRLREVLFNTLCPESAVVDDRHARLEDRSSIDDDTSRYISSSMYSQEPSIPPHTWRNHSSEARIQSFSRRHDAGV